MNSESLPQPQVESPNKLPVLKVCGVGNAGIQVIELLVQSGLPASAFAAINTDAVGLIDSSAGERIQVETRLLRGLGSGGDPQRARAAAEEQSARLREVCEGADVVFIVCGLGGGAGTGIGPLLAQMAKETGALVLAFVALPFECECSRRGHLAQHGLADLRAVVDGTICLPNEALFRFIDENTTVIQMFQRANQLLADAVRGMWRLLVHRGLIDLHFQDVCEVLRDQHIESAFAVAEAAGPTRSREVMDKLLAHPLLEGGQTLRESEVVLVSLVGGTDLTMAEVKRVMSEIGSRCQDAQVLMGAALEEALGDHLAVTVIAARKTATPPRRPVGEPEPLTAQLLSQDTAGRPGSRFVPPPPALTPERLEQMMARQPRTRKALPKMRQGQLNLDLISKGRFDKSEPTIHKGEDLDVPTYIRRGLVLN